MSKNYYDVVHSMQRDEHAVLSEISQLQHKLNDLGTRLEQACRLYDAEEIEDRRLRLMLKSSQSNLLRMKKRVLSLKMVKDREKAGEGSVGDFEEERRGIVDPKGGGRRWMVWKEGCAVARKRAETVKKDEKEVTALISSPKLAELVAEEKFTTDILEAAKGKKLKFSTQREEMRKMGQTAEMRKRRGDTTRDERSRTATRAEEEFEANKVTFDEEFKGQEDKMRELRDKLEVSNAILVDVSDKSEEKVRLVQEVEGLFTQKKELKERQGDLRKSLESKTDTGGKLKRACRTKRKIAEKSRREREKAEKADKKDCKEERSDKNRLNLSFSLTASYEALRITLSKLQAEASEQVKVKALREDYEKATQEAKESRNAADDYKHEKNLVEVECLSTRRINDREFSKTIFYCGGDKLLSIDGVWDALEYETAGGAKLTKGVEGLRKKERKVMEKIESTRDAQKIWVEAQVAVAQTTKAEAVVVVPVATISRPTCTQVPSVIAQKRRSGRGRKLLSQ